MILRRPLRPHRPLQLRSYEHQVRGCQASIVSIYAHCHLTTGLAQYLLLPSICYTFADNGGAHTRLNRTTKAILLCRQSFCTNVFGQPTAPYTNRISEATGLLFVLAEFFLASAAALLLKIHCLQRSAISMVHQYHVPWLFQRRTLKTWSSFCAGVME